MGVYPRGLLQGVLRAEQLLRHQGRLARVEGVDDLPLPPVVVYGGARCDALQLLALLLEPARCRLRELLVVSTLHTSSTATIFTCSSTCTCMYLPAVHRRSVGTSPDDEEKRRALRDEVLVLEPEHVLRLLGEVPGGLLHLRLPRREGALDLALVLVDLVARRRRTSRRSVQKPPVESLERPRVFWKLQ